MPPKPAKPAHVERPRPPAKPMAGENPNFILSKENRRKIEILSRKVAIPHVDKKYAGRIVIRGKMSDKIYPLMLVKNVRRFGKERGFFAKNGRRVQLSHIAKARLYSGDSTDWNLDGERSEDREFLGENNSKTTLQGLADMRGVQDRSFLCDTCGQTFAKNLNLHFHIKHFHMAAQSTSKCSICNLSFRTQPHLKCHMRRKHGVVTNQPKKEKPLNFLCDLCGNSYNHFSKLKHHYFRAHTDNKPYSCETCGKNFKLHCLLQYHQRVHTGEKPFPCPQCSKSFRTKGNLKVHIPTHAATKPHVCPICEKEFAAKCNLRTHMKKHRTGEQFNWYGCSAIIVANNRFGI